MRYSKGIMWLDDCRIPFVDEKEKEGVCKSDKEIGNADNMWLFAKGNHKRTGGDTKGRFTPNLLVCDDALNDGNITSKGKMKLHKMSGEWGKQKIINNAVTYEGDKGSNSRYYNLDLWFDKMLDKL